MPAEHEVEPSSGVTAIGREDAGRGHDLSYSARYNTTTMNAEPAEAAETKKTTSNAKRAKVAKNPRVAW
jgi:hypothetical protein